MNRFVYFVDMNNKRQWKEYDSNNNLVNCSIPDYKEWNESDSNGNIIHSKNSNGCEYWCEYNENNKIIYYKDNSEYEEFYTYFDEGYIIKYKWSNNKEEYKCFNNDDELLYILDSNGNGYTCMNLRDIPNFLNDFSNAYVTTFTPKYNDKESNENNESGVLLSDLLK